MLFILLGWSFQDRFDRIGLFLQLFENDMTKLKETELFCQLFIETL